MEKLSFKELNFTFYKEIENYQIFYDTVPGGFILKVIETITKTEKFFYAETMNTFLFNFEKKYIEL